LEELKLVEIEKMKNNTLHELNQKEEIEKTMKKELKLQKVASLPFQTWTIGFLC
jgi:hypothetical protein